MDFLFNSEKDLLYFINVFLNTPYDIGSEILNGVFKELIIRNIYPKLIDLLLKSDKIELVNEKSRPTFKRRLST